MQFEDLGFCDKGEGPAFVRAHTLHATTATFPNNTSGGQLSAGQAGAAGGFLGMVEAIRQLTGAGRRARGARRAARPGQRLRHGHLRPLPVHRRGHPRESSRHDRCRIDDEPQRKNPVLRTRQMNLPPWARSRVALGMTAAAAEGRFELQVCQRLRRRAVPAARGLPPLPVGRAAVDARSRGAGELLARPRCTTATTCSSASGCRGGSAWCGSTPGRR